MSFADDNRCGPFAQAGTSWVLDVQHRIVAKVDQLMALVDQLEIQLSASRATAEKLMEAVVAELTAPQDVEMEA